jgi:peptide deformylase
MLKKAPAFFIFLMCVGLRAQTGARTQADPNLVFAEKLRAVRFGLRVEKNEFSGSGARVLSDAVTEAHYILVGEDHFTREIPAFTSALCRLTASQGLAGMAMEISPEAAAFVDAHAAQPDHWRQMVAFTEEYPASVAFIDSKQENDLITSCAQLAGNRSFHIWGLDQAFLGSAEWMIDSMLNAHPGPLAAQQLKKLKNAAIADAESSRSNGRYSSLFLLNPSTSEQLSTATPAIAKDGGAAVQRIFQELEVSHQIYMEQTNGGDGNFQRARLLKQNFLKTMESLSPEQRSKKVIVKFGEWHLYKGFNPLHHLDLGTFIAEEADVHNESSLHICILGAQGIHRAYGGYAQPSNTKAFVSTENPFYRWMAPAIANQVPDSWTLYDLRKLRFQKLSALDPDFARVIDGYDLLIIIPELSPADLAQ